MNSRKDIQLWEREWAEHCAEQAEEPLLPETRSQTVEPTDDLPLTVTQPLALSALILEGLRDSIAPDLHTEWTRHTMLQVCNTGLKTESVALKPGYVLQLRPKGTDDQLRDLFVLVLEAGESGDILVVPFGPLTRAAFASELLTDFKDEALRVLCLWNAQWLPQPVVTRSWHIANASEQLLENVVALRTSLTTQKPVPAHLQALIGPTGECVGEQRFVYLVREEEIWTPYLS